MSNDAGMPGSEPGRPLDYHTPDPSRPAVSKLQVFGGALAAFAIVFLAVFFGVLAGIGGRERTIVVLAVFAVVVINAWAFLAYRRPRWRARDRAVDRVRAGVAVR